MSVATVRRRTKGERAGRGIALAGVPAAFAVAGWFATLDEHGGYSSPLGGLLGIATLASLAMLPGLAGYYCGGSGVVGAVVGAFLGIGVGMSVAPALNPALASMRNDAPGLVVTFAWLYLTTPSGLIGWAISAIRRRRRSRSPSGSTP